MNLTKNPSVLTVGAIQGGNRHNIIPEQVEMIGDIRTFTNSDEQLMYKRIHEVVENTAEAAGATAVVEIPYQSHYPVTFNDEALTAAMLPSLQKTAGKENVKLGVAITGAEDFSFLAQKAPGLYLRLGGMTKGKDPATAGPHHTPQFLIDDSAFKTGINALCNLVFDYMEINAK